jgi:hypothetical protein
VNCPKLCTNHTRLHGLCPLCCSRLGGSEADVKEIVAHPFFKSVNWEELKEKKVSCV